MKIGIISISVLLWLKTETYDVRCPGQSEWNLRATAICSADMHYTCLYDNFYDVYSESCLSVEEYLAKKGKTKVKSPGVNEIDCSSDRYQPFIFTTRGNSDCVLDKSFCNEEGQVIANNGSTSTDRACMCDYTKGYAYVTTPQNVCSCLPSEENCQCYKSLCPVDKQLTADYTCIDTDHPALLTCPRIRVSTAIQTVNSTHSNDKDNKSDTRTYAGNAAHGILICIVINTVLLMVLLINVRPYVVQTDVDYKDDLIVDKCESTFTYTVIAGGDLTVKWKVKSKFTVKSIICQKDGEEIQSNKERYTVEKSDKLTAISVTIHKLETEDGGLYTCFVTDALNLTNNCADRCLNISVTISVCNLPTTDKDYICIKGQSVNLEITSKQNIRSVKWCQRTTSNLLIPLRNTSNKYHVVSSSKSSLVVKSAGIEDAGRYICLVNGTNPQIFKMKLTVMLQEKLYKEILQHRETLFTTTSAVEIAYKCLREHGMVCIIGREGTGKSTMCLELACLCEANDILPIKVDVHNIIDIEISEYKTVYIIDDIQIYTQNRDYFQKLFHVNFSHSVKLPWIVISCRTSEWLYLQNALQGIEKIKDECIIQLDNCLTEEDKRKIVEAYFRKNNIVETTHAESNYYKEEILSDDAIQVKLDEDVVKKIIETEPYYGFPLTTVLFCQDRKRLYIGDKYFTEPPMSLLNEIKEIYRVGKMEQKEEQMNEYCVLLFMATKGDAMRIPINTKQFLQIKRNAFSIKLTGDYLVTDLLGEIIDAANRMVGKFLKCVDEKYTFIHPCVKKAVMLSSDYCIDSFLIANSSFDVIEEYVRSGKYEPRRDELIHKLTSDETYKRLCERLVDELCDSIKGDEKREKIYSYMYNEYIKLRDTQFLKALMNRIEAVCYIQQHKNVNISSLVNNVSTFQGRESLTTTKYISARQIILLLDKLTSSGKDDWIYCNQTLPNVIVIGGLIAACKNKYLSNVVQKKILTLLITMLKSKVELESSVESFSAILDEKGNTVFHYLTIYSEAESCFILDTEPRLLLRNYHCKSNTAGVTPLEMAAFMGKGKLLKLYLSNPLVSFLRKVVSNEVNERNKRLLQIAKDGFEHCFGNGEFVTKFNLDDNFEDSVIRSSEFGVKEDYEITFMILGKEIN